MNYIISAYPKVVSSKIQWNIIECTITQLKDELTGHNLSFALCQYDKGFGEQVVATLASEYFTKTEVVALVGGGVRYY